MIWKSTFREIKQSLGRFCAILAIVALGVGFFAGLKVAKPAMVKTAGKYLEEKGFYDYRLLSTLGYTEEEVDFLRQKEAVKDAEGAVSFDIIYQDAEGKEGVVKAHSLTGEVNQLKVLEGRMPQSTDECVVDANLFARNSVGEKLRLSENNTEDDLGHFAYREYTIVGVVQASYYIQYERGNTSLGTGRVAGFIYLPYDGFDVDYFTEIFVKFEQNFPLYSEEYDNFIAEKKSVWEQYAKEAADMRYEQVVSDAEKDLADAREEYNTEKADAQTELDDAKEQLADAGEQITDGEKQLADAKKELADAEKTIQEKTKELEDTEQEIADKEKELADGEQKIQDGIDEWNGGKYKLDQAKEQLKTGRAKLEEQKAALAESEKQLAEGEETLNETENSLLQTKQELDGQYQALTLQKQQLIALYGDESSVPPEQMAAVNAGLQQIAAGQSQVADGLAQIESKRQELEAGKAAAAQGRETIAAYEKEIAQGEAQTADADKQLADSWKEIEKGKQELEDGKAAIADAKEQIADGKQQLEDAKKELKDGKQTLAEKEQELADARKEYEDGLQEYEDGKQEFDEKIADAEAKLTDAEKEIADIEKPDSYLLGRDTNIGYVCFDNDSSIVAGVADVFPVFFFLVAALVCVTTMNRMVEEQRTQIGVLKALGYSDGVIMFKYMFYSGSAAMIGCVAGFAAGTYFFPRIIWEAYGIMYRMDSLLYLFDWKQAVISVVVSLLCSVGTTWLSCRVELSQVAAQLMRPKAPKAGKRVFLEYVPFIWKRMKFLKKVSFRNIFRYKKRLFMMVLGISGCTALLVAAFGIEDSIAQVAYQQFEEIQIYDLNVAYSEPVTESDKDSLREIAGISDADYLVVGESTFDLVTDKGRKSVNVLTVDSQSDISPFVDIHTDKKVPVAFPGDGEVVLTDKIADTYGLKIGDTITLQNKDMETITAVISGISQNFIYDYAYMNNHTYESQMGREAEFKNCYVNLPEGTDAHQVAAGLMKEDTVTAVNVNEDTMARFSSMMSSLNLIVVVVILCAAGLAFIVLYNLTNINITERIREIATIKVLGFRRKETASYVFRENRMLTAMGTAVGLVLGHFLHLFIMNQINIDMVAFDIHVRPISYVYSVLLTFGFAEIVSLFMRGKLERVSMTESLKSVD